MCAPSKKVTERSIVAPAPAGIACPIVKRLMGGVRGWWVELARRQRDVGRLPADVDVDAVGAVLFGLVPGFVFQYLIVGDVEPDTFRRGLASLTA